MMGAACRSHPSLPRASSLVAAEHGGRRGRNGARAGAAGRGRAGRARRPGDAGRPGHRVARRRRSRRAPGRTARDHDPRRRAARRAGLRRGARGVRSPAAGAGRRRRGDREDRVLGVLRPGSPLRVGALLGERHAGPRRQRDAPRQQQHLPGRSRRVPARHLLRPAQRRRVRDQPDRRAVGRPDLEREPDQRRLQSRVRPGGRPLRRRLVGGTGDPVQVAPLRLRPFAAVGHERAARQPGQERDLVPHHRAARARAARPVPRLARGHARRPRGAGRIPCRRGEAVRGVEPHQRRRRDPADRQRRRAGTRASTRRSA